MRAPRGESEKQRERRPPGEPLPDAATPTEEDQRKRLFKAMIASVGARGYTAHSLSEVAHEAGVSKNDAYILFPRPAKRECFLAAAEGLYLEGSRTVREACRGGGAWEDRLRAGLTTMLGLFAERPDAARACIVGVYETGEEGAARAAVGTHFFECLLREELAECPRRAGLPEEVTTAIVGAIHMLIHDRLREGREAELPGMAEDMLAWLLSYETPGRELRGEATARLPAALRTGEPTERLMVAMAELVCERGYQRVRISDLASRSRTSFSTLYEEFGGKEGLFLAAFHRLTDRALEVSETAFAGRSEWPAAMRAVNRELFAYLASEPELTRLALVDVMGAGGAALEARDLMLKPFGEKLMRAGFELAPDAPTIADEACALAVYAAAGRWIRDRGARSLTAVVPLATFLELAPFLGSEVAAALAAGEGAGD